MATRKVALMPPTQRLFQESAPESRHHWRLGPGHHDEADTKRRPKCGSGLSRQQGELQVIPAACRSSLHAIALILQILMHIKVKWNRPRCLWSSSRLSWVGKMEEFVSSCCGWLCCSKWGQRRTISILNASEGGSRWFRK
jgi:hypothetical protein